MSTIKEMKQQLKAMAAQIRADRVAHRDGQRKSSAWDTAHPNWSAAYGTDVYKERYKVLYAIPPCPGSHTFRYLHVVYCLARGRKYEEIEPKVREENKIDMKKIEKMLAEVTREPEVICLGA